MLVLVLRTVLFFRSLYGTFSIHSCFGDLGDNNESFAMKSKNGRADFFTRTVKSLFSAVHFDTNPLKMSLIFVKYHDFSLLF